MSTILVPLDGSPLAEEALPHACRLALRMDAHLLLVRTAMPVVDADARLTSRSSVQHAEAYLRAVRDRLVQIEGLIVDVASLFSNPVPGILRVARTHGVSTIVMSTHGRTGLRRMVLGSVTEQVVQESQVPVLVVNGDTPLVGSGDRYRRVLVPLDGSTFAEAALDALADLHLDKDSEVVLLHSMPSLPAESPEDRLDPRQAAVLDYLAQVAARCLSEHNSRLLAPVEDPATAILDAVASQDYDLIVIAAHARRGRIRFSPTSVAGQVLLRTGTPVYVARGVDDAAQESDSALPEVERSESEEDSYFDEFLYV